MKLHDQLHDRSNLNEMILIKFIPRSTSYSFIT